MSNITRTISVDWGTSGVASSLHYQVLNATGAVVVARTTGLTELEVSAGVGSGKYIGSISNVDDSLYAIVVYDDNSGSGDTAYEEYIPADFTSSAGLTQQQVRDALRLGSSQPVNPNSIDAILNGSNGSSGVTVSNPIVISWSQLSTLVGLPPTPPGSLSIIQGCLNNIQGVPLLGNIGTPIKLWFTVKAKGKYPYAADNLSILQMEMTEGVLYVNGDAYTGSSTDGTITILNSTTGQIQIILHTALTSLLKPGEYYFDIKIRTSQTPIECQDLCQGPFEIYPVVTRAT